MLLRVLSHQPAFVPFLFNAFRIHHHLIIACSFFSSFSPPLFDLPRGVAQLGHFVISFKTTFSHLKYLASVELYVEHFVCWSLEICN